MAYAQGSRSGLSHVVESTFGTTPGTPTMISLPFTTHSLNLSKERVQGNDIREDRMPRVDRHGTRNPQGDIVVDLRADIYDNLLESAFFDTFSSSGPGTLTIGTTPQFMTIEDRATDIAQYRVFTGMAVSQMSMTIQPDAMVETTFSLVGKDMALNQSSLGSPVAGSQTEPFDSFSGSISEGGSTIAIVTSLNFTLNNALAPAHAVGSNVAAQLEYGMAVVEGEISAYFEDNALLDKFIDETSSSLQVVLDDTTSGETYTFDFPNIKYNGGDVPVTDPQSRIITLPFVALYDSSETTNLKLTKSA